MEDMPRLSAVLPSSNWFVMAQRSSFENISSSSISQEQLFSLFPTNSLTSFRSRKPLFISSSTGANRESSEIISCSRSFPRFSKTCTSPVERSAKASAEHTSSE